MLHEAALRIRPDHRCAPSFPMRQKKMVSYCTGSKSGRKDGESIAVFEKRHTGSEREPLQTVFCVKFLVRTEVEGYPSFKP